MLATVHAHISVPHFSLTVGAAVPLFGSQSSFGLVTKNTRFLKNRGSPEASVGDLVVTSGM